MDVSITVTGSVDQMKAVMNALSQMGAVAAGPLAGEPAPRLSDFNDIPGGTVSIVPAMPGMPPAVGAAVATQLDINGLPWDARVNTSNKAQTKKNVWKRVPGITDEVYSVVINELRAAKGLPAVVVEPEAPVVQTAVPSVPAAAIVPGVPAVLGGPVPGVSFPPPVVAPVVPVIPPVVPASVEAIPTTFPELLSAIGKRTVCSPTKITAGEITEVCTKYGLATLAAANSAPQFIPFLYNDMAAIWNTRG